MIRRKSGDLGSMRIEIMFIEYFAICFIIYSINGQIKIRDKANI